jgi:2-polyprenyl-3-methyl-5-hydroxy-6-metoxy-1,4-benzoquinol methylase
MSEYFSNKEKCCLSNEDLQSSEVLIRFNSLPIPGLFFESSKESADKKIPMTLVKSSKAGFIQTIEVMEPSLYSKYKSGQSDSLHFDWLRSVAFQLKNAVSTDAKILEIGGGKGYLLSELKKSGFNNLYNVDPSHDNQSNDEFETIQGLFPEALNGFEGSFDIIIGQHFLEHVPNPIEVLKAGFDLISDEGEFWVEVPNMDVGELDCYIQAAYFYPLHLNHFTRRTLAEAGSIAGFQLVSMELIDHYGKSLWAKFRKTKKSLLLNKFEDSINLTENIQLYFTELQEFARLLPKKILVWGAAEKPHTMLSILNNYGIQPLGIYDSNRSIQGNYIAGFTHQILGLEQFPFNVSEILILSPTKHKEIVKSIKSNLNPNAMIHIPFVGSLSLKDYE